MNHYSMYREEPEEAFNVKCPYERVKYPTPPSPTPKKWFGTRCQCIEHEVTSSKRQKQY